MIEENKDRHTCLHPQTFYFEQLNRWHSGRPEVLLGIIGMGESNGAYPEKIFFCTVVAHGREVFCEKIPLNLNVLGDTVELCAQHAADDLAKEMKTTQSFGYVIKNGIIPEIPLEEHGIKYYLQNDFFIAFVRCFRDVLKAACIRYAV